MIQPYKQFIAEKKNPCWPGYKQIGTKKKNGRMVPNCVKESDISDYSHDFHVNEESESHQEFAENRLAGATKISKAAKEKGGDALLTYHHFHVKLPYYQKAVDGGLDMDELKSEYDK